MALWILPFRTVKNAAEGAFLPRLFRRERSQRQVVWAVKLASRYVPHASCLPQALAAQILLRGAGIESQLRIGVQKDDGFRAHAWVERSGTVLIGGADESARYTPVLTMNGGKPG